MFNWSTWISTNTSYFLLTNYSKVLKFKWSRYNWIKMETNKTSNFFSPLKQIDLNSLRLSPPPSNLLMVTLVQILGLNCMSYQLQKCFSFGTTWSRLFSPGTRGGAPHLNLNSIKITVCAGQYRPRPCQSCTNTKKKIKN